MRLAALSPSGQVLAVAFESDPAGPEEALAALAEFAAEHPEAALCEACDAEGGRLSAWAGDLGRLRRGELAAAELLDRRAAAFRPKPPRTGRTRRRPGR